MPPSLEHVLVARHYAYMCSDPGQALIKDDIRNEGLDRIVVASCSPLMHEATFRRACADAGLNPFLFHMTNIREQCSWVSEDMPSATHKAKALLCCRCQTGAIPKAAGSPPGGDETNRHGGWCGYRRD